MESDENVKRKIIVTTDEVAHSHSSPEDVNPLLAKFIIPHVEPSSQDSYGSADDEGSDIDSDPDLAPLADYDSDMPPLECVRHGTLDCDCQDYSDMPALVDVPLPSPTISEKSYVFSPLDDEASIPDTFSITGIESRVMQLMIESVLALKPLWTAHASQSRSAVQEREQRENERKRIFRATSGEHKLSPRKLSAVISAIDKLARSHDLRYLSTDIDGESLSNDRLICLSKKVEAMKKLTMTELGLRGASGHVECIFGPMFAGKSEELLRRCRRLKHANMDVVLIKPAGDIRSGDAHVTTHAGEKMLANIISHTLEEAVGQITEARLPCKVVAVDEAQMFDDVVEMASILADNGYIVITAGCDTTFERKPFKNYYKLEPLAEKTTKLLAICKYCHADAAFTHLKNSTLIGQTDARGILVGGADKYEPVCRQCHVKLSASEHFLGSW